MGESNYEETCSAVDQGVHCVRSAGHEGDHEGAIDASTDFHSHVWCDETELTRFVYLVEGEPYIGTIDDYATADRNAHYAGLDLSDYVFTFPARTDDPYRLGRYYAAQHYVEFSRTDFNEDDYADVTVSVTIDGRTETSGYRLDGRA